MSAQNPSPQLKIEVRFCKRGDLKYISHLDIVRLFQRSVRRARLPVALSQGFSPHYRISFGKALKLGVESEDEEVLFKMEKWVGPEEFKKKMNEKLPEGVRIVECKRKKETTENTENNYNLKEKPKF